jgi:enoyl-CoA hydratase
MALVLLEKKDNILRVSLNRAAALNAINSALLQELKEGLKEYEKDETVKSLILSGQGGCFASGADIRELASLDEEGIRRFHRLRETAFALLENFHSPTIAVIEKYALGTGLELALCCDFRIASTDAKLGVPSAKLGLVESYEYFARLLRAVGPSWAKKMVFTGGQVDAETAWKIGLVEEISSPDKIFECVDSCLLQMAKNSIASIRKTKKVMADCLADPNLADIPDTAIPLVSSMKSKDFQEATRAFLEKRKRE